jgi:oxygen-independent coproporphyrinogen III oxidase
MTECVDLGLYIHFPFCIAKCAYCDFNSFPDLSWLTGQYIRAVLLELERAFRYRRFNAETCYLGGGTPTVLPAGDLASVLSFVHSHSERIVETTVEANPETVSRELLTAMKGSGVNRISLGVQSLNDTELEVLGRVHNSQAAIRSVQLVRECGFENLSVDLIFGLPGQSLRTWAGTLEQMLSLKPEHISLYALTLEPDTQLCGQIQAGTIPKPDDDLAADMYELSQVQLAAAGYEHYEISNWALPGRQCRHSLMYWHNRPYLGFGAGAWSYWANTRWSNVKDPVGYVTKSLNDESLVVTSEFAGRRQEIAETLILGLRLAEGISRVSFRKRFGTELDEVYGREIVSLALAGLLENATDHISLTPRGRLLGNEVFVRFC